MPAGLGEEPGKGDLVLQLTGEQDLFGQPGAAGVVLAQKVGDRLPLLPLHGGLDEVHVLGGQVPLNIMKDHKAAFGLPPVVAHHVGVSQGPGHHLLPLAQKLNGLHPVPELGRLLKAHFLGGKLHFSGQIGLDLLKLALQKPDGLVHGLPVAVRVHVDPAVAVAQAHVVVEAGPLLPHVPGKLLAAGGQLEGGTESGEKAPCLVAAAVGAEVPGAVLNDLVHQGKTGIGSLYVQADVRVALVILQKDVVMRLVAFNEGVFQHQGLELAVGHDHIKVVDGGDHGPGLLGVGGQVGKILRDPVFQGLGLAHVDDLVVLVLHDVDAWLQRQGVGFFLQFVKGHGTPPHMLIGGPAFGLYIRCSSTMWAKGAKALGTE